MEIMTQINHETKYTQKLNTRKITTKQFPKLEKMLLVHVTHVCSSGNTLASICVNQVLQLETVEAAREGGGGGEGGMGGREGELNKSLSGEEHPQLLHGS